MGYRKGRARLAHRGLAVSGKRVLHLWSVACQLASYRAFWSASDGYLFAHDQVRAFSVAYVFLSLCGLLVSIPVWRFLGLLS